MDLCPTEPRVLASYVDGLWEDNVMGALASYVAIPCLSPDFDPAWADNGEIGHAARLLSSGRRRGRSRAAQLRSSNTRA